VAKAVVTWRKFEFRDAKSSKFWDILLENATYTVRFGKIDTKGQEQSKDFDTVKEARLAVDKLIKEKTGKGYTEIIPPAAVASATTQTTNATNPTTDNGKTRFQANVTGESNKVFAVVVDLDIDGRVAQAHCTCGTFRRDKLRKGPCVHILATTLLAGQQVAQGEAVHA
jgi:predicted DNA-binding WGR domain protein